MHETRLLWCLLDQRVCASSAVANHYTAHAVARHPSVSAVSERTRRGRNTRGNRNQKTHFITLKISMIHFFNAFAHTGPIPFSRLLVSRRPHTMHSPARIIFGRSAVCNCAKGRTRRIAQHSFVNTQFCGLLGFDFGQTPHGFFLNKQ